jgi:hypothetical protein
MQGGVVLDQSVDGGRQHFTVVGLALLAGNIAVEALGTLNDRGYRYLEAFLLEAILECCIVVAGDRETLVSSDN